MFILLPVIVFILIGLASSLAPKNRSQELYSPNKPWAVDAGHSEGITYR